jgi:hypothetical protein
MELKERIQVVDQLIAEQDARVQRVMTSVERRITSDAERVFDRLMDDEANLLLISPVAP